MPTLYAVSIDTEEQWDWSAGWPVRSHSLENIRVVPQFQELCARHGACTTWFTNWSVMNDGPSRDIMLRLAEQPRVELAMHIHPWLTPPLTPAAHQDARASYLHNHPPEQIHAKLASVYELFEKSGHHPRSFRGGRYSSGGAIHDFLMSKGFVADSSVVPFTWWPDDGAPDYRQRDLSPARLKKDEHEQALWELPLTLGFTRTPMRLWGRVFNAIDTTFLRHLRLIGILGKLGIARRAWLNFEDTPAQDMLALLQTLRPLQPPLVFFTVHSSSLVVGGNPYSVTGEQVQRIWQTADEVLGQVRTWDDFQPATACEIAAALEAQYQTCRT